MGWLDKEHKLNPYIPPQHERIGEVLTSFLFHEKAVNLCDSVSLAVSKINRDSMVRQFEKDMQQISNLDTTNELLTKLKKKVKIYKKSGRLTKKESKILLKEIYKQNIVNESCSEILRLMVNRLNG
jgi:hypothetical protein